MRKLLVSFALLSLDCNAMQGRVARTAARTAQKVRYAPFPAHGFSPEELVAQRGYLLKDPIAQYNPRLMRDIVRAEREDAVGRSKMKFQQRLAQQKQLAAPQLSPENEGLLRFNEELARKKLPGLRYFLRQDELKESIRKLGRELELLNNTEVGKLHRKAVEEKINKHLEQLKQSENLTRKWWSRIAYEQDQTRKILNQMREMEFLINRYQMDLSETTKKSFAHVKRLLEKLVNTSAYDMVYEGKRSGWSRELRQAVSELSQAMHPELMRVKTQSVRQLRVIKFLDALYAALVGTTAGTGAALLYDVEKLATEKSGRTDLGSTPEMQEGFGGELTFGDLDYEYDGRKE